MSVEHGIEVLKQEKNSLERLLLSYCWDYESECEMKEKLIQINRSIRVLQGKRNVVNEKPSLKGRGTVKVRWG